MDQNTEQQILDTLREIRDGQREIVAHLSAQRALAEEQLQKSRASIEEPVGLQREALRRQKTSRSWPFPAFSPASRPSPIWC